MASSDNKNFWLAVNSTEGESVVKHAVKFLEAFYDWLLKLSAQQKKPQPFIIPGFPSL